MKCRVYQVAWMLCLTLLLQGVAPVMAQMPPPPPPMKPPPQAAVGGPGPGPAAPATLPRLPGGYSRATIQGQSVYLSGGNFYQRTSAGFQPMSVAAGTRLSSLPPGSKRDWSYKEVVYENNGVHFRRLRSDVYEVVKGH